MVHRSRVPRSISFIALTVFVVAATHRLWLFWLGGLLIHNDGPARADIAVVLAGDFCGHRIDKAAELIRAGYVPAALISGPAGIYGTHESDLAIAFAVRKGYPANWFIPFASAALSTRDEAAEIVPELRRLHVRSFLLITSDYHSARAGRLFRKVAAGNPTFRVVTAPDEHFRADSWWHNREGRKIVFMEWSKTFATAMGM